MGMKDYKFLLRSRDLIVKSEKKIGRINKKMTDIEQKVKHLKSEKNKLRSSKSADWEEEISNRIRDKKKEFEIEKESQDIELKNLNLRTKARDNKGMMAFLFALIYGFASGGIFEYIVAETNPWGSILLLSNCGLWIWILIYIGDYDSDALAKEIIDKYKLSNKKSVIDNLIKDRTDFSKQLKKKANIENELIEYKVQLENLIKEKKELAEVIKTAWKDVSHLVPKT